MNEAKHTIGPWTIEPVSAAMSTLQKDYLIVYSDGELRSHIARLYDNSLCSEHGTTAANAALIAAAPALLEALKTIAAYETRGPVAAAQLVAIAKTAINQAAKGQS